MRGRYPSGPEFVEQLPGSRLAKERARVLLETLAGKRRVQEACALLSISEPRFDQLRIHGLEHLVQSMEPRLAGRPPRTPTPAEERIRALEAEVAALRMQVKIAQARAEIALVLPNAVHDAVHDANANVVPLVAENGTASAGDESRKKKRIRRNTRNAHRATSHTGRERQRRQRASPRGSPHETPEASVPPAKR